MTTRLLLTIITLFFAAATSFAQTEDDNIEFLRVQNQINAGNYRKAIDILSNISSSGKASTFYLSYRATCYEKLTIYDSAAMVYKQLYDKTKSFDAMKKVAEMKDKDDAKRNCPRCHGSGAYTSDVRCSNCNGTGQNECYSETYPDLYCQNTGKCTKCKGTGWGSDDYACDYCDNNYNNRGYKNQGNGKCHWCHGTKRQGTCYYCNGKGVAQKVFYCNH